MTVKAVFRFVSNGGPGWSETWYRGDTDLQTTIDVSNQAQIGWIFLRRTLLHPFFRVRDVRVSNVDNQRDGLSLTVNLPGLYQAVAPRLNEAMTVNDGVLCRIYTGNDFRHWRSSFFRGISEDVSPDGVIVDPLSNFPTNFGHFVIQSLQGQAWQLQTQTRGRQANLLSVTTSDNQITQLILDAQIPDVVIGSTVEVTNAIGMSNVNEKYKVLKLSADRLTLTVRKRLRKSYGVVVPGSGTVYFIEYAYPTVSSGRPERIGTRKTGRPSNLPAGKQRVRRG